MRSVLWHFRWFFRSCWATLARALSVPGRSFVLGCQKLHCRGLVVLMTLDGLQDLFSIFPAFFVFFRGGSNKVAFRAKVDGTWQAKFQRRLRYRATGLRPSGLPNLPFSLFLPFSSFVLFFSLFSPFFTFFLIFFLHLLPFSAFSDVFSSKRRLSM